MRTVREKLDEFLAHAESVGHGCEFPLKLREALQHMADDVDASSGLGHLQAEIEGRVDALLADVREKIDAKLAELGAAIAGVQGAPAIVDQSAAEAASEALAGESAQAATLAAEPDAAATEQPAAGAA